MQVLAACLLKPQPLPPQGTPGYSQQITQITVYEREQFLQHAENGRLDKIKALISENPAYVKIAGDDGWTALFYAARFGHDKVVRYLLEKGADVNHMSTNGTTALHEACTTDHLESVKALVEKGADVNLPSRDGSKPMLWARVNNQPRIMNYLKSKGAKR